MPSLFASWVFLLIFLCVRLCASLFRLSALFSSVPTPIQKEKSGKQQFVLDKQKTVPYTGTNQVWPRPAPGTPRRREQASEKTLPEDPGGFRRYESHASPHTFCPSA
jgi:hypothetical protein